MKAWLVTNKYLVSENFVLLKNKLLDTAKKYDIEMLDINNVDAYLYLSEKKPQIDFCLFWDKDILLEKIIEDLGIKTYNNSNSIMICDDKSLTYKELLKYEIPQPKTYYSPFSFGNKLTDINVYLDMIIQNLGFPMIIKECFGSFGREVYLVNDKNELLEKIIELDGRRFLFQKFIESSYGKDIRVQVVGNKVVCAVLRQNNEGNFRANVALGATGQKYDLSVQEEELAIRVSKVLNLSFAGIDLLLGENDDVLLCEVNSNAHFLNISKFSGVDIASKIFEFIISDIQRKF